MIAFDQYPIFAANQVLRNDHLNQVFNYLDEQGRLTRSQLLGIGIVCGLELRTDPTAAQVFISDGLGVTSAGHLLLWDDPGALTHRRPYTPPVNDAETFASAEEMPQLFELLSGDDGESGTEPLTASGVEQSVVLLYYELFEEDNRNCDPNGCDDRGATMHATVVPLLTAREDLAMLGAGGAHAALSGRSGLPRVRIPRVPGVADAIANRTLPKLATTSDVTEAFKTATETLAVRLREALLAAYETFRPALVAARADRYTSNPFRSMPQLWNSLGGVLGASGFKVAGGFQDRYDHLVTLARAYEELRIGSDGVLTACRPSAGGFPRHLCLGGVFDPQGRHHFLHSPLFATGGTAQLELVRLFDRLLALKQNFAWPTRTNAPEVRATPSAHGSAALSARSIPHLYAQDTTQDALWRTWAAGRNPLGGGAEVLGYRARDWSTDPGVLEPLRLDLEDYNFLRVEGHLGLDYREALKDILQLKKSYRLPIDVVALRTGSGAAGAKGEGTDDCDFDDLGTLYQTLREQFACHAAEAIRELYGIDLELDDIGDDRPPFGRFRRASGQTRPQMPLLRDYAADFRVSPGTVGALYELQYEKIDSLGYIGPDGGAEPYAKMTEVFTELFEDAGASETDINGLYAAFFIYLLNELYALLPTQLSNLRLELWRERYAAVHEITNTLRAWLGGGFSIPDVFPVGQWLERLHNIATICLRGAITKVAEEYARRKGELIGRTTLANFANRHPGLQHGTGVPIGGTLVLIYHGSDTPERRVFSINDSFVNDSQIRLEGARLPDEFRAPDIGGFLLGMAAARPASEKFLAAPDPKLQLGKEIKGLLGSDKELVVKETADGRFEAVLIDRAGAREGALRPGEVIADFFLPYVLNSECAPLQFTLPAIPPVASWEQLTCGTFDDNGTLSAEVGLSALGGTPPYRYTTDDGETWTDLPVDGTTVTLTDGIALGLMDAEGSRGPDRTVRLSPPLGVTVLRTDCAEDRRSYTTVFTVIGGKPPYQLTSSAEATIVEPDAAGRAEVTVSSEVGSAEVTVTDAYAEPCTAVVGIERPADCSVEVGCELPCGGVELTSALPHWLPIPIQRRQLENLVTDGVDFTIQGEASGGGDIEFKTFTAEERVGIAEQLTERLGRLTPNVTFPTNESLRAATNFLGTEVLRPRVDQAVGADASPAFTLAYREPSRSESNEKELAGVPALRTSAFECHEWLLTIPVNYRYGGFSYRLQYVYSHAGLQVKVESLALVEGVEPTAENHDRLEPVPQIPPFERSRLDRCSPESEAQPMCKTALDKINIGVETSGFAVEARLSTAPADDEDLVVYWQALGSRELVLVIEDTPSSPVVFNFRKSGNYEIYASVINRGNGCFSEARMLIEI